MRNRRRSERGAGQWSHGKPCKSAAAPEADKSVKAERQSLLDLPKDMLEEVMLRLPCLEALILGSTCRTLRQLLQPLRPAKLEQYLQSDDVAPELEMKSVDWQDVVVDGVVQLYLSWTVRASRMLYNLVVQEKIPPDTLWAAIIPQIAIQGPKEYLSICCSFGCLDWLSGSMHSNAGQTFLYQHLAHSDLLRLDSTFAGLQEMFVSEGIQEQRIFIHLCKNEPDIDKQQDATLLVYWADGVIQADHINKPTAF